MFAKLRTNRFRQCGDGGVIVWVHHCALKDRPNRHSRDVQYDYRSLLRFSHEEVMLMEGVILQYFY
mgnify:FL=1